MKRNYCLLVNPKANSGKAGSFIKKNEHLISRYLQDVEFYYLKDEESLSELASSKSKDFQYIIACGGDGTARNVAAGLVHSESVLGLLPLGSGNDFAKMFCLTKNLESNLMVLKEKRIVKVDSGRVNDEYFFNTLGLGFDGQTNYYASHSRFVKGNLKYVLAGLKTLIKAKSFSVALNYGDHTRKFESMMLVFANGKWEGGKYFISPNSNNSDGKLELISIKPLNILSLAYEFIRLSTGLTLRKQVTELHTITDCEISLGENVYVHADGEVLNQDSHFSIHILPQSLQVITAE